MGWVTFGYTIGTISETSLIGVIFDTTLEHSVRILLIGWTLFLGVRSRSTIVFWNTRLLSKKELNMKEFPSN